METKKVGDVMGKNKLVTLNGDFTVEEALQILGQYNISSAPLFIQNKVVGFIDVLDLLAYLVSVCTKPLMDVMVGESRKLSSDDLQMVKKRTKDFELKNVGDLVDYSKRNPFHTAYEDVSLQSVLPLFQKGVHRVAVMDRSDKMIGILSQFDLLQELAKDPKVASLKKIVSECQNFSSKVTSVPYDMGAGDAFMYMFQNGVSSLGLMDGQGTLAGTVSAADIKWIANKPDFRDLLRSIGDFVKDIRKCQGKSENFVACTFGNASLFDVVNLMYQDKVHRVFIVDEQRHPKGILSLTDIIREIGVPTKA